MKKIITACLILMSSYSVAALKSDVPSKVCSFLNEEQLPTRGWHIQDGSYAGCSSDYRDIGRGAAGLENNLAYYATGEGNVVKQVKLVLNLNQPHSRSSALQALLQASHSLSVKLTGKRLPSNISQAIQSSKGAVMTNLGGTKISVARDDWPTGKGYELHVIFE